MPTLGGVDDMVGVVCSSAVLAGVLVAVDVAVLVHGLHPTYGNAGLVAMHVAVAGTVLMAVEALLPFVALMVVAMLARMQVAVFIVGVYVCHRYPLAKYYP